MAEAKERSRAGGKKAAGTGLKFEAEATGWLQQHGVALTVRARTLCVYACVRVYLNVSVPVCVYLGVSVPVCVCWCVCACAWGMCACKCSREQVYLCQYMGL